MDSVSNIDTAPEIKHNNTTMERMLDFIIALLPACVFGCILFGIRAAFVLLATVAGALISEFLWNKIRKQSLTILVSNNRKLLIAITIWILHKAFFMKSQWKYISYNKYGYTPLGFSQYYNLFINSTILQR